MPKTAPKRPSTAPGRRPSPAKSAAARPSTKTAKAGQGASAKNGRSTNGKALAKAPRSGPGARGKDAKLVHIPGSGVTWIQAKPYADITYHKAQTPAGGIARIAFDRPEVRNAFRPTTTDELIDAFMDAWHDTSIGVVLFTGNGPSPKDGGWAFSSGGDQRVRGDAGYVGEDGVPRLNVLRLQRIIRTIPKAVIALVPGYAIGGGHVLHVVCDLTIAADNARFGQTGPIVGSFDGGFGSSYLADIVGQKRAREIWYLCRQYDAKEALTMGLVNKVVPLGRLEAEGVAWATSILEKSPLAIRALKSAFNAGLDGQAGIQELAGNATLLYYMTPEAQEGRDAYVQKRHVGFSGNAKGQRGAKKVWLP